MGCLWIFCAGTVECTSCATGTYSAVQGEYTFWKEPSARLLPARQPAALTRNSRHASCVSSGQFYCSVPSHTQTNTQIADGWIKAGQCKGLITFFTVQQCSLVLFGMILCFRNNGIPCHLVIEFVSECDHYCISKYSLDSILSSCFNTNNLDVLWQWHDLSHSFYGNCIAPCCRESSVHLLCCWLLCW
jgi:hypothetical protein